MDEKERKPTVMDEKEKKPPTEVASVTLLSQNPLSCNMCGKVFLNRRELLVHQWSHKERQTFYCPNCEKNFNNENQFKRHMHVHTREGKKYVTCDICKKLYRNNRTLEEHHVKDHTGQKPYRCGTCGIQFSWRENLKKHLHTHIVKPFACMICHESFRDIESLDLHSKIHKREMKELEKREQERREHEERERRRELHKQMGVFSLPTPHHTSDSNDFKIKEDELEEDERGFKCTVCLLSFKYQFTLEAHMKGHLEERADNIKMEEGQVVEEEPAPPIVLPTPKMSANPIFDKPHTCEICNQTFRWAFCLDAHVKIHKQGYDAKEEKEKERKALKTAKERRRQDAIKKALAQQQQQVFGPRPEDHKPEGTTVIVLEHMSEEEKRLAVELGEANGKLAKTPVTHGAKPAVKLVNSSKPNRKRTRREAMAEQLTLEGRDPDDLVKDHEVEISFGDFEDAELESVSSKNNESEEDGSGIDLKAPRLEPPPVTPELAQVRVRGGAKTRGGRGRVSNHIDLNAMVASIGQESRQNLILSIKGGGIRARGGASARGHSNLHVPQQQLDPPVEENEPDADSEVEDEEEPESLGEGQENVGSAKLDSEDEREEEEEGEEEESMDEESESGSEYDQEEEEVLVDREEGEIKSEGEEEVKREEGEVDEQGEGEERKVDLEEGELEGHEGDMVGEEGEGDEGDVEEGDGDVEGEEGDVEGEEGEVGVEAGDMEEEGEVGGEEGDEEDSQREEGEEGEVEEEEEEEGEDVTDDDVESERGETEEEQSSIDEQSDRGKEHDQSESGVSEEGDGPEGSEGEEEVEPEGDGSVVDDSGEEEGQESDAGDLPGDHTEDEEGGEQNQVEGGGARYRDDEEQESEPGQVSEEESGDDEDDDDEDDVSQISDRVNEAAMTMLGLDQDDESSDTEFDDDDDIIDDDVDEQELLKLKMKVYSCELCSKAFVQADLLMEHKVNYHQQNGDAIRNILNTKTRNVTAHTVISGPRSHSTVHRKSR